MDEPDEEQSLVIQRLLRLIDRAQERLGDRDATFARENAIAGELAPRPSIAGITR